MWLIMIGARLWVDSRNLFNEMGFGRLFAGPRSAPGSLQINQYS
jgi:hypothetical protein